MVRSVKRKGLTNPSPEGDFLASIELQVRLGVSDDLLKVAACAPHRRNKSAFRPADAPTARKNDELSVALG
jgi:hypothetical protein